MKDIVLYDNFLPLDDFLKFRKLVTSSDFEWYLSKILVITPEYLNLPAGYKELKEAHEKIVNFNPEKDFVCDEIDNYQFTHMFFHNNMPLSKYYDEYIQPFISLLDMKSLLRAKINLNPRTEKNIRQGFHKDNTIDESFTSVFYFNTNDGYTEFENGEKVHDVENRLITFPSPYYHTGNSCTNNSYRIVLNLNYF